VRDGSFGFFFAYMVASFRWGVLAGMRLTVNATLLFAAVGFTIAPVSSTGDADVDPQHLLLCPMYLILWSYSTSYWGGCKNILDPRAFDVRIHAVCALYRVDRRC
jgi:hypothetical protein